MLCEMLDGEISRNNIEVVEYEFKTNITGAIYDAESLDHPVMGISSSIRTVSERNEIKAHELGHYKYGIRETAADRYALKKIMPLCKLIYAYNEKKIRDIEELSDFLEITPQGIVHGLRLYNQIYGNKLHYNGYIIMFSPFKIESEALKI